MDIFYDQLGVVLLLLILLGISACAYKIICVILTSGDGGSSARSRRPLSRRGAAEEAPVCAAVTAPAFSLKNPRTWLPSLRGTVVEVADGFKRNLSFYLGQLGEFGSRRTLISLVSDLLIVGLISLSMAVYSSSKQGGLDLYMSTYLPMLGVMLLIFWFVETLRGSRLLAFSCALIIYTGITLQIFLKLPVEDHTAASEMVIFAVVSLCAGMVAVPLIRLFCCELRRDLSIKLLNVIVVGLYMVLLLFGRSINGTKAWLYIGSMSFQLTEVTKIVSCAIFALEFTNDNVKVKGEAMKRNISNAKLMQALVTLAINGVFLLVINEFGTLVVLCLVFFVLALAYLSDLKRLMLLIMVGVILVAAVLGVCFLCYTVKYPNGEEAAQTEPATEAVTEAATETGTEASAPAETGEPTTEAGDGEAAASKGNIVVNQGARIYKKFKLRMDLLLRPETVDRNAGGYQTHKALAAVMLSGWLGSKYEVSIPVVASDFIFAYLLMKMGILFGIIVIVLMLSVLINGSLSCLRNKDTALGSVGFAFTLCMVFQSLIAAASASGQFIMIGIPFAFLAEGGSSSLVNYAMLLFILYATSNAKTVSAKPKSDQPAVLRRKE